MSLRNKSVVVTGGAGFIGSHLVDRIVQEDPEKIIVIDNMFLGNISNLHDAKKSSTDIPFSLYQRDVSDYTSMKPIFNDEVVDVVFNLAVIPLPTSLERPVWTFNENNNITSSVCELARDDLFDTLIHFSSSETYGTSVYGDPMSESHPLNGLTPYAASKIACDALVYSYQKTFGIDATVVRPFNNYGPRQNKESYAGVIPITVTRILSGLSPILHGSGDHTRDYLYVTDTADAAVSIYNHQNTRGKVLNIASGRKISISHLIHEIMRIMDYTGDIIQEPERPGDVKCHIADISLARDLINFEQRVDFDNGIKMTIDWYRKMYGEL
jgi:UDP-glucose 4-epimerase